MKPCCSKEPPEYVELVFTTNQKHYRVQCSYCKGFIGWVKYKKIEGKDIKILKSRALY
jgi:hypothetical protein